MVVKQRQEQPAIVTVPRDPDMADQPAETIAKAHRVKIAAVAVLAVLGVAISPELSTNIDTLIQSGVAVAFGVYSLYSTWKQGQSTKDAVYAPSTAAKIAASTHVDVVPGPAVDADV